jgi:hypothetical protein
VESNVVGRTAIDRWRTERSRSGVADHGFRVERQREGAKGDRRQARGGEQMAHGMMTS